MSWHGLGWFRFDESSINLNAPSAPGLYALMDGTTIVLVGQTDDLHKRLLDHCAHKAECLNPYLNLRFGYEVLMGQSVRVAREQELIRLLRPPCNAQA